MSSDERYATPQAELTLKESSDTVPARSVARWFICAFFALLFLTLLLTMLRFIGSRDPGFVEMAANVVLCFLTFIAFALRWQVGWWTGLAVLGYRIGLLANLAVAYVHDQSYYENPVYLTGTAILALLLLMFAGLFFARSVRKMFGIDRTRSIAGVVLVLIAATATVLVNYLHRT